MVDDTRSVSLPVVSVPLLVFFDLKKGRTSNVTVLRFNNSPIVQYSGDPGTPYGSDFHTTFLFQSNLV